MSNRILISGTSSGLGKFLYENLQGSEKVNRNADDLGVRHEEEFGCIIHCAYDKRDDITDSETYKYLQGTIFLTRRLVSIPHRKFIFISSGAVYPGNGLFHSEDESISLSSLDGLYSMSKLFSEGIVQNESPNSLILRCEGLIGRGCSGKKSLKDILNCANPNVSLSGDSQNAYVLQQDVLDFIKYAVAQDLKGIFNLASSGRASLSEVARLVGKKVNFGRYRFIGGRGDNTKIKRIFPVFGKRSIDVVRGYIKELEDGTEE